MFLKIWEYAFVCVRAGQATIPPPVDPAAWARKRPAFEGLEPGGGVSLI